MSNPQLLTGLGAASSIFLTAIGSALASVPSGLFALRHSSSIGVVKSLIPIVIAGVLSIYGVIVATILASKLRNDGGDSGGGSIMSVEDGYRNLSAGLAVGSACLASGIGMAKFLMAHNNSEGASASALTSGNRVRDNGEEPLLAPLNIIRGDTGGGGGGFWTFACVLVFLEAIGLYGLIVALFLISPDRSNKH